MSSLQDGFEWQRHSLEGTYFSEVSINYDAILCPSRGIVLSACCWHCREQQCCHLHEGYPDGVVWSREETSDTWGAIAGGMGRKQRRAAILRHLREAVAFKKGKATKNCRRAESNGANVSGGWVVLGLLQVSLVVVCDRLACSSGTKTVRV